MRWPLALVTVLAALLALSGRPPRPPLDPQSLGAAGRNRASAVQRGLQFIHRVALVPENFAKFGQDFLLCFATIARTSADPDLREKARSTGRELALRWVGLHNRPSANAGATELYELAEGSYAAACLGVPSSELNGEIERASKRLTPEQFFGFDPEKEPPPDNIPRECVKCGARNPRGTRNCKRCGTRLEMRDRYGIWCDALIVSFTGERCGVRLGGTSSAVVRWSPRMQPYPAPGGDERAYRNAAYAVTHLIYGFSEYNYYRLRRERFPLEFAFLESNLAYSIRAEDPELIGESMDTLKSFGVSHSDPLISGGIEFLLAHQNPDGSWGDPADPDVYNRYHATWTAIDGLRDYAWHGEAAAPPATLATTGAALRGRGRPDGSRPPPPRFAVLLLH